MPDILAKTYSYILIGSGLLGLCLHAIRASRRSAESEYSRRHLLRRKSLFRECLHLVIGGVTLALFYIGLLGGWGVIVLGGTLLILVEFALALLIKTRSELSG
jgi:hypothetical protein